MTTRKWKDRSTSAARRKQGGYALLLVVFLTMLLLLSTIVAAPSVRTQRRREKEEEMIWRGKQYVRAIKLYYRKNGRFPTSMDNLIKPQVGMVRYLRQAYKDPMNKEDGTWRLIYVGPAGQLIGSMKPPQTLQFQSAAGGVQAGTGTPASGLGGFGSTAGANGTPPQGAAGSTFGSASPGTPGTTPAGPGTGTADSGTGQNPSAPAPIDTSGFVGGNIVGIGSKATKDSIIIYEKATNYHLFEFIWDPSKDVVTIGGTGTQVGTPNAPGQNPGQPGFGFGSGPGTFGNQPQQSPPAGNQAPGQPTMPPLTPNGPPQQ